MAEILHFRSRAELNAQANLEGFVEVCRDQLTVFGSSLDFKTNTWDITEALALKRGSQRHRLIFSTWGTANDPNSRSLAEPFLSFAKAYMRYQHAFRPTKVTGQRMAALRALEAALTENGGAADPTQATVSMFNRASQLCAEKFEKSVSYRVSGQLQMLSEFMNRNCLLAVPVIWRNPLQRLSDTSRIGPEFDKQRHERLPSPAALSALANIFRLATEPADVFLISVIAILCSAPDRISEVLYLEENCEATRAIPSTGQTAYGLRWRPAKGADPMVKWIIPSMADVVKEALQNIRTVTEPARQVARWYEAHPQEIFLPAHLEHLRRCESIGLKQLEELLFTGSAAKSTVRLWCKANRVEIAGQRGNQRCRFSEVQAAVLRQLPSDFPWAYQSNDLKYSEALCMVRRNELHRDKATYRCLIDLVTHGSIADALGGRTAHGGSSLFDRFGFTEEDGSALRVSTHQFRHYLNTLAQAGGLSQLDITKWSGRKDVRQNRAYDHQSDRDIVALVRSVVGDPTRAVGSLATIQPSALIPRDEFARLKVPTAHTTEFGYCIHDFSMLPCQLHRDCLNCDEQVCIKGDATKEANIRRQRQETQELLESAMVAMAEGTAGANRWLAHQQVTLARLNELCAILDDPNVPPGTVIQPARVVPASRLEQVLRERSLTHSEGLGSGLQVSTIARLSAPEMRVEEEAEA
jgi:hypothetical protein